MPSTGHCAAQMKAFLTHILLVSLNLFQMNGHCGGVALRPRGVVLGKEGVVPQYRNDASSRQGVSLKLVGGVSNKEGVVTRPKVSGREGLRYGGWTSNMDGAALWRRGQDNVDIASGVRHEKRHMRFTRVPDKQRSIRNDDSHLKPVGGVEFIEDAFTGDMVGDRRPESWNTLPVPVPFLAQSRGSSDFGVAGGSNRVGSHKRWTNLVLDQVLREENHPVRIPRHIRALTDDNPLPVRTLSDESKPLPNRALTDENPLPVRPPADEHALQNRARAYQIRALPDRALTDGIPLPDLIERYDNTEVGHLQILYIYRSSSL